MSDTVSTAPSTVCPSCRSSNWLIQSQDVSDRTVLVCNECGHEWVLCKRRDLRATVYEFPCPSCGGSLHFYVGQVAHLPGGADVPALDGTHLAVGELHCDLVTARWVNPPDTASPMVIGV